MNKKKMCSITLNLLNVYVGGIVDFLDSFCEKISNIPFVLKSLLKTYVYVSQKT